MLNKYPSDQPVLASAQRSAGTGYSNSVKVSSYKKVLVAINITAKSGTPNLSVQLQSSPNLNESTPKWYVVYDEDTITNDDLATLPAPFLGQPKTGFMHYVRIKYIIAGTSTPKVTFSANIFSKD